MSSAPDPPNAMAGAELARFLDHTRLAPDTTTAQVDRLCAEASRHGFCAVCVNGAHVARAARHLEATDVLVACTVGFPLGANDPSVKAAEARRAIEEGARELDMVLQVGALVAGDESLVLDEVAAVVEVARPSGTRVKVILETSLLTDAQKVRGAELVRDAGAHFVKTSTGFGPGGATVDDVALLARTVGPGLGVKAAGGIRTAQDVRRMLAAGATRVGSSSCVAIVSAT